MHIIFCFALLSLKKRLTCSNPNQLSVWVSFWRPGDEFALKLWHFPRCPCFHCFPCLKLKTLVVYDRWLGDQCAHISKEWKVGYTHFHGSRLQTGSMGFTRTPRQLWISKESKFETCSKIFDASCRLHVIWSKVGLELMVKLLICRRKLTHSPCSGLSLPEKISVPSLKI